MSSPLFVPEMNKNWLCCIIAFNLVLYSPATIKFSIVVIPRVNDVGGPKPEFVFADLEFLPSPPSLGEKEPNIFFVRTSMIYSYVETIQNYICDLYSP